MWTSSFTWALLAFTEDTACLVTAEGKEFSLKPPLFWVADCPLGFRSICDMKEIIKHELYEWGFLNYLRLLDRVQTNHELTKVIKKDIVSFKEQNVRPNTRHCWYWVQRLSITKKWKLKKKWWFDFIAQLARNLLSCQSYTASWTTVTRLLKVLMHHSINTKIEGD